MNPVPPVTQYSGILFCFPPSFLSIDGDDDLCLGGLVLNI